MVTPPPTELSPSEATSPDESVHRIGGRVSDPPDLNLFPGEVGFQLIKVRHDDEFVRNIEDDHIRWVDQPWNAQLGGRIKRL